VASGHRGNERLIPVGIVASARGAVWVRQLWRCWGDGATIPSTRVQLRETTTMSCDVDEVLMTTTQAGRLIGRTGTAVRDACVAGKLAGQKDSQGFWLIREADLRAWDSWSQRGHGPRLPQPRTDEVVALLSEWGCATAEELGIVMSLHVGNVRKYLAILAAQGLAERRDDGQWILTSSETPLAR
jgi:hypothetical protein